MVIINQLSADGTSAWLCSGNVGPRVEMPLPSSLNKHTCETHAVCTRVPPCAPRPPCASPTLSRRPSPRAPRLPFRQEEEDKGPHPSPRNPHPHPLQTTPSSQKREGRSHVCAKGAKRTNDAPLGTADSWEPWPQPAGPCHSRRWVDTFAVNPWPRRSTDPPRRDPTPGTRGRTYRVRCWRSRTKPRWESRTDAADCWPSDADLRYV
ncbi:ATP synthase subunit ATP5MJ, mitochondrial isoform X1 [Bos taurus]|uniref:ATP synthase subunit ATP5MJ, mitochondrial isoform X1 n=1 Tax=Bos taurus TaxID=9913 RepID=UPI0028CB6E88|nr:ATP synthase subunit ATP5MJ, mitochondrial isoform X1 [Bos taurus]